MSRDVSVPIKATLYVNDLSPVLPQRSPRLDHLVAALWNPNRNNAVVHRCRTDPGWVIDAAWDSNAWDDLGKKSATPGSFLRDRDVPVVV